MVCETKPLLSKGFISNMSAQRKRSVSQGSSPVHMSPGTRRILRQKTSEASLVSPNTVKLLKRSKTSDNLQGIELDKKTDLGQDVPFEIAIKRVLVCAQRNDWSGCEQALRYLAL